jgi:tripartite-type tricarboxylate transporter receptor subunit TctC
MRVSHPVQLFSSLLVLIGLLCGQTVSAQSWPARPVRLIVPFPPAGATDILARELAKQLSERLGQQVVIDNKPGAGGTLGSDLTAKAPADGYTIQMATSSTHSIGPSLNPNMPYNARTDFTPVALVASAANVLLVSPAVKAGSVKELIAEMKARPGQFNYGSSGNGTIVHLTSELFKAATGTFAVHIPYRGTALVIPDLLAGQVHLLFDNIASAQPHLKGGKLRALGVTSTTRSALMPELAPIADSVPGFESVTWFGIFGPRGVPAEVTTRLNAEVNAALAAPEFQQRLKSLGFDAGGGSPADFARRVERDSERWAQLIKSRGIKAE